jgi:hypothetical protein
MKGTWWGAGLLAAALLAVPQVARADEDDWRRDGRYGDDGYYRDGRYRDNGYGYGRGRFGAFDEGFERGFRAGTKQGNKDVDRRRGFNLRRHDQYRDADDGYHSRFGSRRDYESGYRRGFEQGYRAVFDRRGRGRWDDRYARPRRF